MILSTMIAVQVFDPWIETALFLFLCVLTLAFIIDGANNFENYNKIGKGLVFSSLLPLAGLIVYGGEYGIWTDEISNVTDTYVQNPIGSGMENAFLITACLLTILAKSCLKDKTN